MAQAKKTTQRRKAQGQVRRSQMLTTYGPGAMVDLPDYAVIIGGLEFWRGNMEVVHEERLQAKLAAMFDLNHVELRAPPIEDPADPQAFAGVRVYQFPEWFVANYEKRYGERNTIRARPLVHMRALERGQFVGPDKKRHSVVPMRFVQACVNGHVSDIDWYRFVHPKDDKCRQQLWLEEHGTSGDFGDIAVRCDCGRRETLNRALQSEENPTPLGFCRGERPWLGRAGGEVCSNEQGKRQLNKLLTRTATSAYFSQNLSVIHIPEVGAELRDGVGQVWDDFLRYCESIDEVTTYLKNNKVRAALGDASPADVWGEIQRRLGKAPKVDGSIKDLELQTLLACPPELSHDVPHVDFFARCLPQDATAGPVMAHVDQVVLVHRLREVRAQIGFTRFEPAVPDIDGELSLEVHLASLTAEDPRWFPAVEIHGEGVFLSFDMDAIAAWKALEEVQRREQDLRAGYQTWLGDKKISFDFPGVEYYMLHSLSHLLLTAVALECGYSASAIKERIYKNDHGCGILLYTGTPDSEGTLGGLVEVGRHIERHLGAALRLGRLCSNDPVCAQQSPKSVTENHLNGAACHGCLLVSESSCERQNSYLDRALVVATVDNQGCEFFRGV